MRNANVVYVRCSIVEAAEWIMHMEWNDVIISDIIVTYCRRIIIKCATRTLLEKVKCQLQ